MLTDKMRKVEISIKNVIHDIFPKEYQEFVFDEKIQPEDIVTQIMFECCKYAYDRKMPQKSIRAYLKESEGYRDDNRMRMQNTVKKINSFREKEYEIRKQQMGLEITGLLPIDMTTMDNKTKGYKFNDFQFWEISNVHDMKLVDSIINGRFINKNFTAQMFREYAEEYDNVIVNMKENYEKNPDKVVFASMSMFVLGWKYAFDFYYEIAREMEKSKVTEVTDLLKKCSLFCGSIGVRHLLSGINPCVINGIIHTESRMLFLRKKFISEFVTWNEQNEIEMLRYAEAIVMVSSMLMQMTLEGINIREWFVKNSEYSDWESVMKKNNIFDCYELNKKWTSKRIKYVKNIYKELYKNKNPEICS